MIGNLHYLHTNTT